MTDQIPISVIVATHSRADYLEDCLRTLAAQKTDVGFEVLIVDNASTDRTPELAAAWSAEDARFRAISEPRVGKSRALNTGISRAAGDILLFTDDDVLVDPHWVDRWHAFFTRERLPAVPFIAGGMIRAMPDDREPWPAWMSQDAILSEIARVDYGSLRTLGEFEYVWGANFAMTRQTYDAIGPWNEDVGRRGEERATFEDLDYNMRVDAAGGTRWFCPEMIVHHKVGRSHLSPRRLMRTAHYRGRFEHWHDRRKDPAREAPSPAAALLRHVRNLAAWLWTAILFRSAPSEERFERTRLTAAAAGYSMQVLRREERTLLSRATGRATTIVLNWTGSLMPVLTAPRSTSEPVSWPTLDERLRETTPEPADPPARDE